MCGRAKERVEYDIYRCGTRKFDFQIGVARANGSRERKRKKGEERREKERDRVLRRVVVCHVGVRVLEEGNV